jgi:hypothetical protein
MRVSREVDDSGMRPPGESFLAASKNPLAQGLEARSAIGLALRQDGPATMSGRALSRLCNDCISYSFLQRVLVCLTSARCPAGENTLKVFRDCCVSMYFIPMDKTFRYLTILSCLGSYLGVREQRDEGYSAKNVSNQGGDDEASKTRQPYQFSQVDELEGINRARDNVCEFTQPYQVCKDINNL